MTAHTTRRHLGRRVPSCRIPRPPRRCVLKPAAATLTEPRRAETYEDHRMMYGALPNGLTNPLRAGEAYTAEATIRQVPVTITGPGSKMHVDDVWEIKEIVYSLNLLPGAHIFVDGPGRVRVEQPGGMW